MTLADLAVVTQFLNPKSKRFPALLDTSFMGYRHESILWLSFKKVTEMDTKSDYGQTPLPSFVRILQTSNTLIAK